jgi:hypothetical protein
MNTPRAGTSADRAGRITHRADVSTPFDPGGVAACSHGWSIAALGDAQPVESVVCI